MTELVMGVRVLAASDEKAAFTQFYATTWPDVFAFAATLLRGDLVAAEEVAQEAMARVCARFGGLTEPRPYLYRTAENLVRRRWRHGQREPLLGQLPETATEHSYDHTADAVRQLPAKLRQVVVLHYYADLPLEVVARTLHRPLGTVKRHLHEARGQLATLLGEDVR